MLFQSRQKALRKTAGVPIPFSFYHRYWPFSCPTCQSNQVQLNSLSRCSVNWEKKTRPRNLEMQCISNDFFSLFCTSFVIKTSPYCATQKKFLYQLISLKKIITELAVINMILQFTHCINFLFIRKNIQICTFQTRIICVVSIIAKLP